MRRKPARAKPTPWTAPTGEPVGIVVPTALSSAVTGGSVLALALTGSLVLGRAVFPFGTTLAENLRHPGSIAALPRPQVAPPQALLPTRPPRVIVPRRTATVFLIQPASAGTRLAERRRPPTRVTHRPRKGVDPHPGTSDGTGSGGPKGGSGGTPGGGAPGSAPGGGSQDGGGCSQVHGKHGKHGHCACHGKHQCREVRRLGWLSRGRVDSSRACACRPWPWPWPVSIGH